jgi:2-desacetyl-2-hydroxyethyl bacteriochlorophyllide A dehydrogenase
MRALVLTGPGRASVEDVPDPRPAPGQAVVAVHRVGVCGTDEELFSGEMAYFRTGRAAYPLRPGHEWAGVVEAVAGDVDPAWVGTRVTGDTMLACGRCDRCTTGRRHVCRDLVEVGISMGHPGALAERLAVPVSSLRRLPDSVDDTAGAMVEPGGNAWRAAAAAHAGPATRVLVVGSGAIGLLAAMFAKAAGAEVHLIGRHEAKLELARSLGVDGAWTEATVPGLPFLAVIDATDDPEAPAASVQRVEPGGRVVLIGLSGAPSRIDTRDLALGDKTAVGLLSGSPGLDAAIEHYADGRVDPHPLVAATVGLDEAPAVLARAYRAASAGPKIHIDPRR